MKKEVMMNWSQIQIQIMFKVALLHITLLLKQSALKNHLECV